MRVFALFSALTLCACATGATQQQLRDRAAFDLNCPSKDVSVVEIDARTRGVTGCDRRLTYVEQCRPCANGHVSCDCTWILNAQGKSSNRPGAKPVEGQAPSKPRAGRDITVLLRSPSLYKAPLFDEEIAPLHRATARFLEQQNPRWKVVPWNELVTLRAAALKPQHPSSKLSCRNAPAAFELINWKYRNAHQAQLNLSCHEGCKVTVNVRTPKSEKKTQTLGRWRSEVPNGADADAWVEAVAKMKPHVAPPGRALLGALSGGGKDSRERPKVEVRQLWTYGDWVAQPRFDQKRLDACWQQGQRYSGSHRFNLELNDLGTPLRCEETHSFSRKADGSAACICSALKASNFGKGSSDRRLQVQLMQRSSPRPVVDGKRVFVSSEGWLSQDPFAAARGLQSRSLQVEACFNGSASDRIMRLPLRWTVGPDGSTQSFALGESPSPVSNEQAACVRAALSQAEFPCPLNSEPVEVQAQLVIRYAPAR